MTERFKNRVWLRGTLELESDLYLGDGGTTHRPDQDPEESPLVASVARDAHGRPVIPGAALKGVLRAYAEEVLVPANVFTEAPQRLGRLFGRPAEEKGVARQDLPPEKLGEGGSLLFHYAYLKQGHPLTGDPTLLPDWEPNGRTGIAPAVGIDRVTRTASERRLFFQEFVPAGTAFRVEISGQNLERGDDDLLLAVLEGFHDAYEPIRLGGGSADHRGRATWKLEELRTLDAAGLQEWLQAKPRAGSVPSAAVPQPDPAKQQAAAKQRIETLTRSSPRLVLAVELRFDGPFLVNDPSRYRRQAKKADAKQPDHSPRLTRDGKPLLPASALRGAVRSQAERIARTLNAQAIGDPHRAPADRPEDHVAPLERAFGYSGQVAAIEFTDFVGTEVAPRPLPLQQFVAIDRFTGGAAHEKLFNAEYVWMPVLEGKIYVALDERVPPWMLGLLALTMRDLIEGDITLGFGAAKGYGACRAAIRIPDCKLAGVERLPHDHAYGKLLAGIPADQERAAWLMKPEGYETVLRMCLEQLAENIPALAKSQKVTP